MELSSFLIRVIFIALPGIIASMIFRALQGEKQRGYGEGFLEFALFSLLSYAILGFIGAIWDIGGISLQALFDESIPLYWPEIIAASLIGALLAFIAAFVDQKKLIFRLGKRLNITTTEPGSVWQNFLSDPNFQKNQLQKKIIVRDHKANRLYYGFIIRYSLVRKELMLQKVDIHINSNGKYLHTKDMVYISRNTDDLTIEIPENTDDLTVEIPE